MISISHSPNSDLKQQALAAWQLIYPKNWFELKKGKAIFHLEKEIEHLYGGGSAISFSAGRECLLAVLQAMGVKQDDEVVLQSYTCIVVPNAIIWSGAIPRFVDVDSTLNLDPAKLEEAISERTKAIIVQHTFGIPAEMDSIMVIANKHGIPVIEDCAHALGAKYKGQLVGSFGIASFFSFGRDKIISSVSGGAIYTKDTSLSVALKTIQTTSPSRSLFWIKQNLLHPLLVPWMARLQGRFKVGQVLMLIAQKLRLINKVYTENELHQEKEKTPIHPLPNAMAKLALQQLHSLDENLSHRRMVAEVYQDFCDEYSIQYQLKPTDSEPAYLRFTVFTDTSADLMRRAKQSGYLFGDWYKNAIMPYPEDRKRVYFNPESVPASIMYAERNLNLPTHKKITLKHLNSILRLVKKSHE